MFRPHLPANDSSVDLATVRETILYMYGDVEGVPGMEGIARSLAKAISEIDMHGQHAATANQNEPTAARFFPRVAR